MNAGGDPAGVQLGAMNAGGVQEQQERGSQQQQEAQQDEVQELQSSRVLTAGEGEQPNRRIRNVGDAERGMITTDQLRNSLPVGGSS